MDGFVHIMIHIVICPGKIGIPEQSAEASRKSDRCHPLIDKLINGKRDRHMFHYFLRSLIKAISLYSTHN